MFPSGFFYSNRTFVWAETGPATGARPPIHDGAADLNLTSIRPTRALNVQNQLGRRLRTGCPSNPALDCPKLAKVTTSSYTTQKRGISFFRHFRCPGALMLMSDYLCVLVWVVTVGFPEYHREKRFSLIECPLNPSKKHVLGGGKSLRASFLSSK